MFFPLFPPHSSKFKVDICQKLAFVLSYRDKEIDLTIAIMSVYGALDMPAVIKQGCSTILMKRCTLVSGLQFFLLMKRCVLHIFILHHSHSKPEKNWEKLQCLEALIDSQMYSLQLRVCFHPYAALLTPLWLFCKRDGDGDWRDPQHCFAVISSKDVLFLIEEN